MAATSPARLFRWGILGTGGIATKFATGLAAQADAKLVAVGSRSQAAADAFGDRFAIPHRHASYADLAADPEVDAIYIATPHPFHLENMLTCIDAGKAVLCEKPFTLNAQQARRAIEQARRRGVFLMEAMWTRFLPLFVELRRLLAEQAIGELRLLQADFGFRTGFNPQGRLFDPALGGGALLDVGVYTVSLAHMLLGAPARVTGLAELGATGVDEQSAYVLGYAGGQLAVLSSAIRTATPQEALIVGTAGQIRIHSPWWRSQRMTLRRSGADDQVLDFPLTGNGYHYEAAEVQHCMAAGATESAIMPLDETLAIMTTLDRLRAPWGLRYPGEE
jgi:predicted dehydrogenase